MSSIGFDEPWAPDHLLAVDNDRDLVPPHSEGNVAAEVSAPGVLHTTHHELGTICGAHAGRSLPLDALDVGFGNGSLADLTVDVGSRPRSGYAQPSHKEL